MHDAANKKEPPHPYDGLWYVHIDGKTYGPYSGHQIRNMAKQDQIIGSDFVHPDGGSNWGQAADDPILGAIFRKPKAVRLPLAKFTGFSPRRVSAAISILFLCIAAWIAWPYYAAYDLVVAIRDGNVSALENRIAWDSVRRSLRDDLNASLLKTIGTKTGSEDIGSGLAVLFGPAVINQMVDGYVTPQGIANLIRSGKPLADDKKSPSANLIATSKKPSSFKFEQIKYAFFSGSPLTFMVQLAVDNEPTEEGLVTLLLIGVAIGDLAASCCRKLLRPKLRRRLREF